jgi:hypothetical protein
VPQGCVLRYLLLYTSHLSSESFDELNNRPEAASDIGESGEPILNIGHYFSWSPLLNDRDAPRQRKKLSGNVSAPVVNAVGRCKGGSAARWSTRESHWFQARTAKSLPHSTAERTFLPVKQRS